MLQPIISGISPILGLRTRMKNPFVYVVVGVPEYGLQGLGCSAGRCGGLLMVEKFLGSSWCYARVVRSSVKGPSMEEVRRNPQEIQRTRHNRPNATNKLGLYTELTQTLASAKVPISAWTQPFACSQVSHWNLEPREEEPTQTDNDY